MAPERLWQRFYPFKPSGVPLQGGLSAENYIRITDVSRATTCDLAGLVDKGALFRMGDRKHTRYYLNVSPFTQQQLST